MPVYCRSVSPSNLYGGSVHVLASRSLGMGCVISDLAIGDVGMLSWVVVSLFVIFIRWSQVSCSCCALACHFSHLSATACANCSSLHHFHIWHVFNSVCNRYPQRHRQGLAGFLMAWESVEKSIDFCSTDGSPSVQYSGIRVLQVVHSG